MLPALTDVHRGASKHFINEFRALLVETVEAAGEAMPKASKWIISDPGSASTREPPPALRPPRFDVTARLPPAQPVTRLAEVVGFGRNPGRLRMYAYVPDPLPRSPALVVVLHGCLQTAAGYDLGAGWSTLADRFRFTLLFPEQQRANNRRGCFNWFQPRDSDRDQGEALSIGHMVEHMIQTYAVDRSRVFVTGLSAGGAMTSVML